MSLLCATEKDGKGASAEVLESVSKPESVLADIFLSYLTAGGHLWLRKKATISPESQVLHDAFFSPERSCPHSKTLCLWQDREMAIQEERAACPHGSGTNPGWPWAAVQQKCSSQSSCKELMIQWGHIHSAHVGSGFEVPESSDSNSVAARWGS